MHIQHSFLQLLHQPQILIPLQVVNSSDESDEEEQIHRPPKRLYTRQDESEGDSDSDVEDDDEPPPLKKTKKLTAKLSVDEAEMLAMKLLGSG